MTRFYAPLFDSSFGIFHFFYGFPKNNVVFDFGIGFVGFYLGVGVLIAPGLPADPLSLVLRFGISLWWITFLLADIFGRKRKFTAIGAGLACLFLAESFLVPLIKG